MAIGLPIVSKFDDAGVKKAGKAIGDFGSGLKKVAGLLVAAFAVDKIKDFAVEAVRAAEGVQQANNRLGAIADSMGLFGAETEAVTQRMIDFAEANEISLGTDAEVIKAAQAKLLTFKNLAASADETGGAFDRATLAAIDLAEAGFGEATSNATQLGKALQDPVKGISALTRVGVTFTDEQKNLIKQMVASNDILGAQELVLSAIEEQVAGTAKATATASEKMELAFGNLQEEVGLALLPAFEDLVEVLVPLAEDIGPELAAFFEDMSPFLTEAVEAFADMAEGSLPLVSGFFEDLKTAVDGISEVLAPLFQEGGAFPAMADIFAEMEEPVGEVVGFLATLGEEVLKRVNETVSSQGFKDGMTGLADSLGTIALESKRFVESNLGQTILDLGGPLVIGAVNVFAAALERVADTLRAINDLIAFLSGQKTLFVQDMVGILNVLTDLFPIMKPIAIMFENMANMYLNMKGAGKKEENFRVPALANGGIVKARPGGTLALIGEGGRDEAVIPLGRGGGMMGGVNITINAGVGSDPVAIGRYVTDAIKRYENVSGKVFARA
jgi:hypothetical protein